MSCSVLLHTVINTSVCAAVSPVLGAGRSLSVTLLLPAPPPLGTQLTLCQWAQPTVCPGIINTGSTCLHTHFIIFSFNLLHLLLTASILLQHEHWYCVCLHIDPSSIVYSLWVAAAPCCSLPASPRLTAWQPTLNGFKIPTLEVQIQMWWYSFSGVKRQISWHHNHPFMYHQPFIFCAAETVLVVE